MHREDIYKWNNSHRPPAEDLRYPKAQERSLYNHIGPKKKRKMKRRWSRIEPAPLAGSWRWGGVPTSRWVPSPAGGWQKRSLRGSEASPAAGLWQTGQSETYTDSPCQTCTPVTQGLGAGMCSLQSRPREGTALVCGETTWENESKVLHNQECSWRKHGPPQKGSTMAEWLAKGVATIAASLLTPWPLPPPALGRDPTRASSHNPVIASSISALSTTKPGWHAHPDHQLHSNPHHSTLLPEQTARPICHLGFFLPDGLVCSGNLWSRLFCFRGVWGVHTTHTSQRWGWNHSWAQGPWNLRKKSLNVSSQRGVTPLLLASQIQHLQNIPKGKQCSCRWERSGFSSCGLGGHVHMGGGPG